MIQFIGQHILDKDVQDSIVGNQNVKVLYLPNDWQLNDTVEKPCTGTLKKFDIDD